VQRWSERGDDQHRNWVDNTKRTHAHAHTHTHTPHVSPNPVQEGAQVVRAGAALPDAQHEADGGRHAPHDQARHRDDARRRGGRPFQGRDDGLGGRGGRAKEDGEEEGAVPGDI